MLVGGDIRDREVAIKMCENVIALCQLMTGHDPVQIEVWGSMEVAWLSFEYERDVRLAREMLFHIHGHFGGGFFAGFDTTPLGIECHPHPDHDLRFKLHI